MKAVMMNQKIQNHTRAPRFSVPNEEPVVLRVGPERVTGTLRTLSCTGGTMRLPRQLKPGTFVDIGINTVSGRFTAAIELLGITTRGTRAFRFVQIGPTDQRRLEDALDKMRALGFEKDPSPKRDLVGLARRMLLGRA